MKKLVKYIQICNRLIRLQGGLPSLLVKVRARLDRARLGRARSGWARLGRARLDQVRSGRVGPGRVGPGQVKLENLFKIAKSLQTAKSMPIYANQKFIPIHAN
jgi:hypothetical protein